MYDIFNKINNIEKNKKNITYKLLFKFYCIMPKKRKSAKEIMLEEIEAEERLQKEFLTEKERRSFEQVEKYVDKTRSEVEKNMHKKKSERVGDEDFRKFKSKSEKDRYEEARLESMISQVWLKSKNSSEWLKSRESKIFYIIYLVIIVAIVVFCVKHFIFKYL